MKLNDDEIETLRRAGRIAARARKIGAEMIKPGVRYFDVAEKVEEVIISEGALPAFPVNIAVNEIAAHYSPYYDDELVFQPGDIVKLDLGANIDGYLSDTAITVGLPPVRERKLIDAPKRALDAVAEVLRDGMSIADIGGIIEDTIKRSGAIPIENLTGHSIERNSLHAGLTIPNVREEMMGKVIAGDVIAIEPFATQREGFLSHIKAGSVKDGKTGNIYIIRNPNRSGVSPEGKELMSYLLEKWPKLPFCHRWLVKAMKTGEFSSIKNEKSLNRALLELMKRGAVYEYKVLVETRGKLVSQWEHTFIITEDDIIITTE